MTDLGCPVIYPNSKHFGVIYIYITYYILELVKKMYYDPNSGFGFHFFTKKSVKYDATTDSYYALLYKNKNRTLWHTSCVAKFQ